MPSVRVAVLSDDRFFCQGVLRALGTDPSLALAAYSEGTLPCSAGAERYSIVIIDARMPGALAECAALAGQSGPSVILVGAPDTDAWALDALSSGARGIVTKAAPTEDVARAIHVAPARVSEPARARNLPSHRDGRR